MFEINKKGAFTIIHTPSPINVKPKVVCWKKNPSPTSVKNKSQIKIYK